MEDTIRRYHLRDLDSYQNERDLVQNYRRFLSRNGLLEAYYEKFDDEEVVVEMRKVLAWNEVRDNMIIKDKHVEAWARENEVTMVNEY